MDHEIWIYEELECPKHGFTTHVTHVEGHITCCFGPDPDDVPVPIHTEKKVICIKCLNEYWEDGVVLDWKIIQVKTNNHWLKESLKEEDH